PSSWWSTICRTSPTSRTVSPSWRAARCWPRATTTRCPRTPASSRPITGWYMARVAAAIAPEAAGAPLLAVRDVNGWYDESHVLHGMSFDVHAGEVVTLLGRNGAGKTTTLKAIMGILGKRTGSIR